MAVSQLTNQTIAELIILGGMTLADDLVPEDGDGQGQREPGGEEEEQQLPGASPESVHGAGGASLHGLHAAQRQPVRGRQ